MWRIIGITRRYISVQMLMLWYIRPALGRYLGTKENLLWSKNKYNRYKNIDRWKKRGHVGIVVWYPNMLFPKYITRFHLNSDKVYHKIKKELLQTSWEWSVLNVWLVKKSSIKLLFKFQWLFIWVPEFTIYLSSHL